MSTKGAPKFTLKLGGTELTDEHLRHALTIEFVESIDKLDALTIQFVVPAVNPALILDLARLGNEFEVILGYADDVLRSGFGDITEANHRIAPKSPWSVTLTGLDGLHRLRSKRHSKVWDVSHSAIAESIASENGLSANCEGVDSTPAFTFQPNVDDASFLRLLAREHNYFVRVEEKELRFGRRNIAYNEPTTVTWGEDLDEIVVRASLDGLVTSVMAKGQNYEQDTYVTGTAASGDLKNISGGTLGVDMVAEMFGDREHLLDHALTAQSSGAQDQARSEFQTRAEKFVSGSVTTVGKPEAVSGGLVQVDGLKWPFSGPFLIQQVTHILEPGVGYRTRIEFCSDSLPPEN